MAPPEPSIHSGRSTRSQSISSDRTSLTGYGGLLSPPISTSPEPGFIAASAASQIVTNDHDSRADTWFDQNGIEPSGETALVARPALKLVNRFLDQLLFNFLSLSKSTSLAALRPAVSEVLKKKLAKDAVSGADQELHEYLGGGEEEELDAFHNGSEPKGEWDLELVWKRTRLRCMVYSSLGDMEEEEEDYYTEEGHLDGSPGSTNRFPNSAGVVSPAVAIFLTSILEYMGEQVLIVAGQAAYQRLKAKHEREERDGASTPADIAERVVVEKLDMERVALDRTLGRLWRGWKKQIRSPTGSVSMGRSFSRDSLPSSTQAMGAGSSFAEEETRRPSLAAVLAEHDHAASIPLPISDNDIREIEIPGLVEHSDDEDEGSISFNDSDSEVVRPMLRPKSLDFFRFTALDPSTPVPPQSLSPIEPLSSFRKRSHSLPSQAPLPYKSHSNKRQKSSVDALGEEASLEENVESETMPESVEESMPATQDDQSGQETEKEVIDEGKSESKPDHGLLAGILTSAAALGTVAVTGIVAAAHGQAPETALEDKDETDAEGEVEKAQIMTSSRISVGGRASPDVVKAISRQSSVRPPSVHSLRLIDVTSPKSPGRSRDGSIDAADYAAGRPTDISRTSSIYSPVVSEAQTPRMSNPVSRGATASPIARNGSAMSVRHGRNSAGDSISKVEEIDVSGSAQTPPTAIPADFAAATQGIDFEPSGPSQQTAFAPAPLVTKSQPSTIVHSSPPTSRSLQESTNALQNIQVPIRSNSRSTGAENGAPPLTPLREMVESVPDSSDGANAVVPGSNGPSQQQRSSRVPTGTNRSSPTHSTREETLRKTPSESSSKSQRPTHTSGSSSGASGKIKAVRTSDETAVRHAVDDKNQSFEQLIRSDQTIQYTLTPQNMRNIEGPDSPTSSRYASPAVAPAFVEAQRPATGQSHSSSLGKYTAIQSNQAVESPKPAKVIKPFKPVPRPMSNTGAKLRANTPQARDARVDRDSMGDFAEFIRSTGPANSYEPAPSRAVQSHRGINGTPRNASGSAPRVAAVTALPRRAESSAGRSRLQARDAVVPRGDSISDLIDFVRSGPQLDKDSHRIPRTVAPFRNTMDSDQMAGAVGGKAIDASLPDPRYSQASTSVHSSVNSQSALLGSSSKNKVQPPAQNRNILDEADMMPKRKTRRVRDPYSIDLSDEDEEYEAALRPQPIKEESLADFLRNVPPPSEPTTTSVFETVPKQNGKNIKKKSSSPSLMSRFGRNQSSAPPPPKSKSNGNHSTASRTGPNKVPTHTPIATQFSSHQPSGSNNYAAQVDSARNKVIQKTYQPREAVYSNSRTTDLADFLKQSEPPTSNQAQPQTLAPTLQKEEGNPFQRMFGRKKVH